MQKENDLVNKCGTCNALATKKCSACRQISYCSKEHQKEHWKSHRLTCKPFIIKKNEIKGRYVVASRDIKVNETLYKEDPIIIGPKLTLPDPVCLGCLKLIISLSSSPKCPKCKWPICNIQCSGLNNIHRFECTVLAAENRKGRKKYRYELITPLRCLLLKRNDPIKWELIFEMEGHLEERKPNTDIHRDVQELYSYLKEQMLDQLNDYDDFTENLFHRVYGILEINGLDVPTKSAELLALYQNFVLTEHSCLPNIKIYFDKLQLIVKSAKSISKNENLRTTYTNVLWGTNMRQNHLKNTKYFFCTCPRCRDPTELGTNFSALLCLQDNCNGCLLPTNPLTTDSIWKCSNCLACLPSNDVNDIISRLTFEVDQILEQSNPKVNELETLLVKLLSVLHPHHYNCFSIKHSLIQLYGHKNGYQYSNMETALLNKKLEYCQELLSILSILDETYSRATFYVAVIKYELSAVLLETMRRTFLETLNLSLISDDGKKAKSLLVETVILLEEDKNTEMSFQLIRSCKNLFKEVDDITKGHFFTDY